MQKIPNFASLILKPILFLDEELCNNMSMKAKLIIYFNELNYNDLKSHVSTFFYRSHAANIKNYRK